MGNIRLATVFSGIGAIEQAFKKSKIKYDIVFACDNGERTIAETKEEIFSFCKKNKYSSSQIQNYVKELYSKTKKRNYVKESYFGNYKISEDQWHEDIRFIDGNIYKNKVDIFVGGSPCQSFSNMGKRGGLEDTRGTLFYEFARLVDEIQPEVFIYENVPGMLNHDNGNTWDVIKGVFYHLGYKISYDLLNSKFFGIPQNRTRLYVVGFKNNDIHFEMPKGFDLSKTMFDFLEDEVDPIFYLKEKGFKFVTTNKSRAKVNENVIRTQKRNQEFNWNGDFVFQKLDELKNRNDVLERAFVGQYNGQKGVARMLTPRECLRLMGFSDNFKILVPNTHAYMQSGNSIVVNVLESILLEILKTGVLYGKN